MDNTIKSVDNISDFDSHIKWRLTDCCNFGCSYCIRPGDGTDASVALDEEKCVAAADDVNRVAEELRGSVDIDLIGGEVTLFNLKELLKKITSGKLKQVTITSNFSADIEYYADLAEYCNGRGVCLGLALSWHGEFMSFEEYSGKMSRLMARLSGLDCYVKAEVVARNGNERDVSDFKDFCERRGINYIIDADRRNGIGGNVKGIANQTKPRYRVVYRSGREAVFMGRSEFFTSGANGILEGKYLLTRGFFCSRDVNFVYIEKDRHIGIVEGSEYLCKNGEPLSEFHVRSSPVVCRNFACSLCGRIDVWRE